MGTINVVTYNIRTDVAGDGINAFATRKEFIKAEFPKYQADLIGFQETKPHQRQWVADNLEDMEICGVGRDADLQGESNIIAFNRRKFDLVSLNTFWLSDTPHKAGSRFSTDQSSCPRICTAVTLMDKETGRCFRHYNTHLDHMGAFAQAQGISLILGRIASDYQAWPLPVILTGDFNVTPDSPVVRSVLGFEGCGAPLKDVTADVGPTFHGYHPDAIGQKIDYIFTNLQAVGTALTAKDEKDGIYLSDHYPVVARLRLE